ncbi:MAG: hypothetical protein ACK4PR_05815 [Gammaproteobacteria bacterium]
MEYLIEFGSTSLELWDNMLFERVVTQVQLWRLLSTNFLKRNREDLVAQFESHGWLVGDVKESPVQAKIMYKELVIKQINILKNAM